MGVSNQKTEIAVRDNMDIKVGACCLLILVLINLATAQKKKTTVTGDVTRDRGTGTRVDLGVSHRRGNWELNGSGFGTSRGHRGGSLGASFKRKNFEFGGSVFGDNRGNRGGRVGFKLRFRRSTQVNRERFEVIVFVNHCNFNVYDKNEDDVITLDEMRSLFPNGQEAERLFNALDTSGDGEVTVQEFEMTAPNVINSCEQSDKAYNSI